MPTVRGFKVRNYSRRQEKAAGRKASSNAAQIEVRPENLAAKKWREEKGKLGLTSRFRRKGGIGRRWADEGHGRGPTNAERGIEQECTTGGEFAVEEGVTIPSINVRGWEICNRLGESWHCPRAGRRGKRDTLGYPKQAVEEPL